MNKKIAIKYGAISGLFIVSTWYISYYLTAGNLDFGGSEVIGYAVMLLGLSAVFMGIKNKRDQSENSLFSIKEGFLTGLGIVLVASSIYVIGWMIYVPAYAPDFADKYSNSQIELVQKSGVPEEQKQMEISEIKRFNQKYKMPHYMAFYTFLEIILVGIPVAFLSAVVLRRKK